MVWLLESGPYLPVLDHFEWAFSTGLDNLSFCCSVWLPADLDLTILCSVDSYLFSLQQNSWCHQLHVWENWTFDLFLKLILSASHILRTLQYQDPCLHDVLVQKELLGFLFLYLVQVSLELIFICEKKLWGDYNSESFLRTHVMLVIHLVILLEGHLFPRKTLFLHTFSFPFDCTAAT